MIISVAKADHIQDRAVMCTKKEKFFCNYQQALWQSNLLLSVSLQVTERRYWKQHSSGILHWSPFQRKFCFLGKNYRQSMYATEPFVFISKTINDANDPRAVQTCGIAVSHIQKACSLASSTRYWLRLLTVNFPNTNASHVLACRYTLYTPMMLQFSSTKLKLAISKY